MMPEKRILQYFDSFLGWTDDNKPTQKARRESFLSQLERHDGIVYQRRDFIFEHVIKGYTPEIKCFNGKNEYWLCAPNENIGYTIKKTEYDFAQYIIQNQLHIRDNYIPYLKHEKEEKERVIAEQERQEREKREQEEKEIQEEILFHNWLSEATIAYNDSEKLSLLTNIWKDYFGQFVGIPKEFVVLVDNFDNERCKQLVISRCARMENKASRSVFTHITGLRLPVGINATIDYMQQLTKADFGEMIPYIPKADRETKKREHHYERFYIYDLGLKNFKSIQGEKYNAAQKKYDIHCFVHKSIDGDGKWVISDTLTGMKIVDGNTEADVKKAFNAMIDNIGTQAYFNAQSKAEKMVGKSPYQG